MGDLYKLWLLRQGSSATVRHRGIIFNVTSVVWGFEFQISKFEISPIQVEVLRGLVRRLFSLQALCAVRQERATEEALEAMNCNVLQCACCGCHKLSDVQNFCHKDSVMKWIKWELKFFTVIGAFGIILAGSLIWLSGIVDCIFRYCRIGLKAVGCE